VGAKIRFPCCGGAFVDQTAEPISTFDSSGSGDLTGRRVTAAGSGREGERAMRPVAVVLVDEDAKQALEARSVED
jgi:hypothetical protein